EYGHWWRAAAPRRAPPLWRVLRTADRRLPGLAVACHDAARLVLRSPRRHRAAGTGRTLAGPGRARVARALRGGSRPRRLRQHASRARRWLARAVAARQQIPAEPLLHHARARA